MTNGMAYGGRRGNLAAVFGCVHDGGSAGSRCVCRCGDASFVSVAGACRAIRTMSKAKFEMFAFWQNLSIAEPAIAVVLVWRRLACRNAAHCAGSRNEPPVAAGRLRRDEPHVFRRHACNMAERFARRVADVACALDLCADDRPVRASYSAQARWFVSRRSNPARSQLGRGASRVDCGRVPSIAVRLRRDDALRGDRCGIVGAAAPLLAAGSRAMAGGAARAAGDRRRFARGLRGI